MESQPLDNATRRRLLDRVAASHLGKTALWVAVEALDLAAAGLPIILGGAALAPRIGLSRVAVNAAIRQLAEAGFLSRSGRHFAINVDFTPTSSRKDTLSNGKAHLSNGKAHLSRPPRINVRKDALSNGKDALSENDGPVSEDIGKAYLSNGKAYLSNGKAHLSEEPLAPAGAPARVVCLSSLPLSEIEESTKQTNSREGGSSLPAPASGFDPAFPAPRTSSRPAPAIPGEFAGLCAAADRIARRMPGWWFSGDVLRVAWAKDATLAERWAEYPLVCWTEALYAMAERDAAPDCPLNYYLGTVKRMAQEERRPVGTLPDGCRPDRKPRPEDYLPPSHRPPPSPEVERAIEVEWERGRRYREAYMAEQRRLNEAYEAKVKAGKGVRRALI